MYAILEDGELIPAPREFIEDGRVIRGFTDDFLRKKGYKPVRWAEAPSEEAIPKYTENKNEIVESWKEPQE